MCARCFPLPSPDSVPRLSSLHRWWDGRRFASHDPFPPLTFLEGNGYWQLVAAAGLAERADQLGFKLRRSGETIVLATPNGVLIDAVEFGQQQRDVSEGRYPDGAEQIVSFDGTPTPGRPNRLAKPVDDGRELQLQITCLLYTSPSPRDS